ncbi:MAG: hypothetical protein ACR2RL_21790 [Gammaproteobacteria bacterium]
MPVTNNDPTQPLPGATAQPSEAIPTTDVRRQKTGDDPPAYGAATYEMNRPFRIDIDWSKHSFGDAAHAYGAQPPSARPTSRERDGTGVTANNLSAYA